MRCRLAMSDWRSICRCHSYPLSSDVIHVRLSCAHALTETPLTARTSSSCLSHNAPTLHCTPTLARCALCLLSLLTRTSARDLVPLADAQEAPNDQIDVDLILPVADQEAVTTTDETVIVRP